MPIDYWIAKTRIVAQRSANRQSGSVHHRVHGQTFLNGQVRDLQLAINVLSRASSTHPEDSHVRFLIEPDFQHPLTLHLENHFQQEAEKILTTRPLTRAERQFLEVGALALRPAPADTEIRLDYVRSGLFDPALMQTLPPSAPGKLDDLQDHLRGLFSKARNQRGAFVYVFGEMWMPKPFDPGRPPTFPFEEDPGRQFGLHDIHMNQGNEPRFKAADGIHQDGGLLFHFPHENRWVGVFLAFQNQSWYTDDQSGHALD